MVYQLRLTPGILIDLVQNFNFFQSSEPISKKSCLLKKLTSPWIILLPAVDYWGGASIDATTLFIYLFFINHQDDLLTILFFLFSDFGKIIKSLNYPSTTNVFLLLSFSQAVLEEAIRFHSFWRSVCQDKIVSLP